MLGGDEREKNGHRSEPSASVALSNSILAPILHTPLSKRKALQLSGRDSSEGKLENICCYLNVE